MELPQAVLVLVVVMSLCVPLPRASALFFASLSFYVLTGALYACLLSSFCAVFHCVQRLCWRLLIFL